MKRLRFYAGTESEEMTVPEGSQILSLSVVANPVTGTWLRINESKAIWIPAGAVLDLTAEEFGACLCETARLDQYPGDQQIRVAFGEGAQPPDDPRAFLGPDSWLIVVNSDC